MSTRALLLRRHSVLPGFNLSLGFALLYLCLVVLIPLSAVFLKTFTVSWSTFVGAAASPRVLASYRLTFGASLLAALVNGVFGLLVAWVLVRYRFAGKRVVDALVDLPFALPTAVAGIALTTLYASNGWIGRWLPFKVAYTPLGVFVALTFIGLPFVVRTVQPVLEDLQRELEEAAATLGASRLQTFAYVIFPALMPALLTGFALAFARALGEYGSVIFIAGNMPMVSEITSLLIITKLEQYDYTGATAIAVVMLVAAFALLLLINLLQAWARKRQGR
ncbi:MAG TPA: sulfate ABC transporter permease subunit CysT [Burkholderiaceae bacterium]|jgi:sulfate transport system permease protein|nr:sulfate ABC transporter permease subunit CysT [Burkholderiaceae bacterium]